LVRICYASEQKVNAESARIDRPFGVIARWNRTSGVPPTTSPIAQACAGIPQKPLIWRKIRIVSFERVGSQDFPCFAAHWLASIAFARQRNFCAAHTRKISAAALPTRWR
jgi:hypothetical protein